MLWKIDQFIFCEKSQSITAGNETVRLEPLLAEVLSYFCNHPDVIVSRDQLIEDVWQSRTISDNAVNRVIARLRKVLGDDTKLVRFIATYPKRGYRFIALVNKLDTDTVSISSDSFDAVVGLSFVFMAILLGGVLTLWTDVNQSPYTSEVSFLTRGGYQEILPAVSPGFTLPCLFRKETGQFEIDAQRSSKPADCPNRF